jgi:hypothetical protein
LFETVPQNMVSLTEKWLHSFPGHELDGIVSCNLLVCGNGVVVTLHQVFEGEVPPKQLKGKFVLQNGSKYLDCFDLKEEVKS